MSKRPAKAQSVTEFEDLGDLCLGMLEGLQPPERLSPAEAAEKYRIISNPGAYSGPFRFDTTPYMRKPLDALADRTKNAVVFGGGAQTGKTESLVLNALAFAIKCMPVDSIVYQTSQKVAADFSRTRVDRMHRSSPLIGECLLPGSADDTVHSKFYKSGIVVNLSWPAINEMSGRPRGLAILTDYDRMPQDIDGEGSPFYLARKRTTTYGTLAKTICESTPGFIIPVGTTWLPKSPHEMPPCQGIVGLYNQGDRHRWYWPCPECGEWFEPTFDRLRYPADAEPAAAGRAATMECPHCRAAIHPNQRYGLNLRGQWVADGQRLNREGGLHGDAPESDIASFWLAGPASAFVSWATIVSNYINAEREYQRSGDQEPLKSTTNLDQGQPYAWRGAGSLRTPEEIKNRAETWQRGTVPKDVRFLVTTIDVQGRKWVVQVHGVAPGSPVQVVLIDRYDIAKSARLDPDGHPLPVDPGSYLEDWELLRPVIEASYPIGDGSGRRMQVKHTFCDSGGREGVTTQAYLFWLSLRADGLHRRFQLVKGDPLPGVPRAHITYPDANKKDKHSPLRGDVPVLMLNSNVLKDQLDKLLDRNELTKGVVFPEWLPDTAFHELCVEVRTIKGWENTKRKRNETWDLLYYCLGGIVWLGAERIDWQNPPSWALPSDSGNPLVSEPESVERPATVPKTRHNLADLGKALA